MSPGAEIPAVRYPNMGQTVLLVMVGLGLQVATGATAFAINSILDPDGPGDMSAVLNVWVLIPVLLVANGLTLALGLRGTRETMPAFLRMRSFLPGLLPWIILTSVGLAIVLNETDNCFLQLIMLAMRLDKPPADLIDLSTSPLGAALLAILVAPLSEEYLFRGLILRGLLTRYSRAAAVVTSALAFGFIHGNLRQFVLAVAIGLVFGWWYSRTLSVAPGLVGHATFNTIAWGSAQLPDLSRALGLHTDHGAIVHEPWWFTIIGVALVAFGIWKFHRDAYVIGTDPSPPTVVPEPPLLGEPPVLSPN